MSPLLEAKLARERSNFDGTIEVIEDRGTSLIVLVIPEASVDGENIVPGDWGKRTKPFLMLLDKNREHGKFIAEADPVKLQ